MLSEQSSKQINLHDTHKKNKSNVNWILLVTVNNSHLLAELIGLCCQLRSQREDPTPAGAIKSGPLILI